MVSMALSECLVYGAQLGCEKMDLIIASSKTYSLVVQPKPAHFTGALKRDKYAQAKSDDSH